MKPREDKVTDNLPVNQLIGEDQNEYLTLPAHVTKEGIVSFSMELDDEEIEAINKSRTIHVMIITYNRPFPPINMAVDPRKFEEMQKANDEWLQEEYKKFMDKRNKEIEEMRLRRENREAKNNKKHKKHNKVS
jgi:hypothetical protein